MTKHAGKHRQPVCEMYVTSHKRPFVPSVVGIGLLCNIKANDPVSFVKCPQIPLDGSVNF